MPRSDLPAVIEPDKLYRLDEFCRIAGVKEWALRQLRRNGLKVHRLGNRRWIKGADFIALVEQQGEGGAA